jgi:hypothetical protein
MWGILYILLSCNNQDVEFEKRTKKKRLSTMQDLEQEKLENNDKIHVQVIYKNKFVI